VKKFKYKTIYVFFLTQQRLCRYERKEMGERERERERDKKVGEG
jgi:hypothetical protein